MQPPSPQLDEHGFPVRDDRPQKRSWNARGVLLIAVIVGVVGFVMFLVPEGRSMMAQRQLKLAQEKIANDDLPGALPHLERALEWAPNQPKVRLLVAHLRLQAGDAEGALKEYDAYIELNPNYPGAYTGRAEVFRRLGRYDEAIADTNTAVKLSPDNDHAVLNNRAYTRAIANKELDPALNDIQRALQLAPQPKSDLDETRAMYLDTRGFIYHRLGREDEALADLDEAITFYRQMFPAMVKVAKSQDLGTKQLAQIKKSWQQNLAVMLHHRGEVYQAQGQEELAKKDLEQADVLGYDPANGVF